LTRKIGAVSAALTARSTSLAARKFDTLHTSSGGQAMSRQLENLKRVFGKLQSRYGADDALVSQFRQEVQSREIAESGLQPLTAASPGSTPRSAVLRRREVVSRYPSGQTDLP
jgi:hypothetical protein